MRTFYFDMDGVLVHFNEEDSVTRPFFLLGAHYYRKLEPNPVAVELFKYLNSREDTCALVCTRLYYRDAPKMILPQLLVEQETDKLHWCEKHLGITYDEFFCLPMEPSKDKVIDAVPHS